MTALVLGLLASLTVATWTPVRPPSRPVTTGPTRPSVAQGLGAIERATERVLRHRTTARQDVQLPDLLERIATGLRSGLALGPSVLVAVDGAPAPLARSLGPLVAALRHGADLRPALEQWARTPRASDDVRLVAAALDLSAEAGGATARAVDRIAATLRERREVQAEARALATQARASAGVLAVAPILFTALVAMIEPEAAAMLVTTPIGLACLLAGLGLGAAGAIWMNRIVERSW